MKHSNKLFILCAAFAVALGACGKEEVGPEITSKADNLILTFSSEKPVMVDGEQTKTVWKPGEKTIYWSTSDKIRIAAKNGENWQNHEGDATESKGPKLYESNQAGSEASVIDFKVPTSFALPEGGSYKFYGIYPSAATGTDANHQHMPSISVTLPSIQTPAVGSFDATGDIMVAESGDPVSAIPTDPIKLNWTRVVAHGDITLKKLPVFEDGEIIRSITLTAQEGADLTGSHYLMLTTGEFSGDKGVNYVTIKASGENLAKNGEGNIEFWFTSLPFTATSLKAEIKTNKYIYAKQYNGISKEFKVNTRNILGISMSNCSKTVAPAEQLIEDGTYVISTKYNESDLMMVANTGSGTYQNYADLSTTVEDEKIVVSPNAAWVITYNTTGGYYHIANADTETKLTGSSGSSSLTLTANGAEFFIEEIGNGYHIKTSGNTPRWIGYNNNNGNGRFSLYNNDSSYPGIVSITPAKVNAVPVLEIDNLNIGSGQAVSSATEIVPTTRKYVTSIDVKGVYSDQNCTTAVSWLNVTFSENKLFYTAEANETGGPRTAYVKVQGIGNTSNTADVIFSVTQPKLVSYLDKWVLVSAVSELAAGDKIVIVNAGGTKALGTTQNSNNRNAVDVSLDNSDNNIVSINSNTQQITLGKSGNNWTLSVGNGYLFAASSTANHLKTRDNNDDGDSEWSISIDASSIASITAQGDNTRNQLKNNGDLFSCYSSGQTAVKIYKYHPDGRPEAPISWSDDEGIAEITDDGTINVLPSFENPYNLDVTFTSSVPSVASIDGNGIVEILAAGETVISAEYNANTTSEYKTTVVEYTLSVTDSRSDGNTPTPVDKTYSFAFTVIGTTGWSSGYADHTLVDDNYVTINANASKQTGTITDYPVTKGQPVTVVLKDGTMNSVTFTCSQWTTKAQTITLHYSTNKGNTFTSTNITSSNFSISNSSLPSGTNAVKITFSSTSNQVGLNSVSFNYTPSN